MIKDDGAGVYTWNNTFGGNRIEGNIILHGIGSGAGTANPDQLFVSGIYIDDRSSNIMVNDNTVAYCPTAGIYIHNARQLSLSRNTLFGNGNPVVNKESGQLLVKLDAIVPIAGTQPLDLHFTENKVVTTQEGGHCVYLRAEKRQDLNSLGSFDHNQYSAPGANQVIAQFYPQHDLCDPPEELSLVEWQSTAGHDKGSAFNIIHFQSAQAVGENLVRNSRMTLNTDGWMIWPAQVSILHDKKHGADGPSLNVQFPSGHTEALLYHAGIKLNRNKQYRLSFAAKSTKKSRIEFVPLMAAAPWDALGAYTCFSIDTTYRTFTCFFKPYKSHPEARVNFKSNAPFWIDNVTLYEVTPPHEENGEPARLLYNAVETPQAFSVTGKYGDILGNPVSDQVTLPGYGSIILLMRP